MREFSPAQRSVFCGQDIVYKEAKSRFLSRLQIKQTISQFPAFFSFPKGYKGREQAIQKLICISIKTR